MIVVTPAKQNVRDEAISFYIDWQVNFSIEKEKEFALGENDLQHSIHNVVEEVHVSFIYLVQYKVP